MNYQRPENELVVLCSRANLCDDAQTRIKTLLDENTFDWDYCFDFARHHHVTPLLCYHMERLNLPNVSQARRNQFKVWYHRHSFRNLFLTSELLKTQRIFKGRQIPVLTVKGPVLSKMVYGDVTLREYADVDLVVRVDDISRLKEALLNTGYKLDEETRLEKDSIYMQSHYNYPFTHQSGVFNLEVHWRLWESEFESWLHTDTIWQHTTHEMMSDNESVITLNGHYLLLYLLVHGTKHQWSRLSWICDVNELLSSDVDIDWEALRDYMRTARMRRVVLLGLLLARDLLGAALPDAIIDMINADRELHTLANETYAALFAQKPQDNRLSYFLRMREHPIDKARHVLRMWGRRMVPSMQDTEWIKLPRSLYFLYYLARPVRILASAIWRRSANETNSVKDKT